MPILGSTGGASVRAFLPLSFKRRLTGWSYGKKIVIPNQQVDANLTNFPVTVYLDSTNFDFSKAKADGSDIRFTDKDYNHLKFERKEHNYASFPSSGFPVYLLGVSRTLSNNILTTYDDVYTGSGNPQLLIDFKGYTVNTLEISFHLKWYNAQPSINQLNNSSMVVSRTNPASLTYTGATTYASENLYTSFGYAANGDYDIVRSYTYSGGKNDLALFIEGGSYQYNGGYLQINYIKVNGGIVKFNDTNDTSTTSNTSVGNAVYNVLLPTVSDTVDTEFYMWYGNSNAYNTSIEAWQDQTGKQLTYTGNVNIRRSTGNDKGAYFDGSGDALYTPHNNSLDLSTNNFTIECALTLTGVASNQNILRDSAGGKLALYVNNTNNVVLYLSTASGTWDIASNFYIGTFANGTKFDVAITRSGSTFRVFFNGNLVNSFTNASAVSSFNGFYMGAELASGSITYSMNGYMHGLRITNGRARYTSSYTPPTSFVIDGTDVVFNTNFDTVYDNNYVMVHHMGSSLVDASGNGKSATATGTTVTSNAYGQARSFNGTSDYLSTTLNPSTTLGNNFSVLALANPSTASNYKGIFGNHYSTYTGIVGFQYDSGTWAVGVGNGSSWNITNGGLQSLVTNKTEALGLTISSLGGYLKPFVGGQISSQTAVNANVVHSASFDIGRAFSQDSTRYFAGTISEIRVSNTTRSDAWIELESKVLKNNVLEFADVDDSLLLSKEYELLGDITVGTATTSISFNNLDISPEDELVLVGEIYNPTTTCDVYIYPNGSSTLTNYWQQYVYTASTTVGGSRLNRPFITYTDTGKRDLFILNIKLTNNGFFIVQGSTEEDAGTSTCDIIKNVITSTITFSSISSLTISTASSGGIGVGSRFQLYKINGTAVI